MTAQLAISLVGVLFTLVAAAVGYGALKKTVAVLEKAIAQADIDHRAEVAELKSAHREEIAEVKAQHREALNEFRASRDKLGERVGDLATRLAVADNELSRPYRVGPSGKKGGGGEGGG